MHRHPLPSLTPGWRAAAIAFVLIAILALVAACGGDDPTPTPTATPALEAKAQIGIPAPSPNAAATPALTATPAPTFAITPTLPPPIPTPGAPATPAATPRAMPEHTPMGDLRDLVINPKTVGKQLLDPLSADEVSCVKEAVGEDFYTIIQVTPIAAFGGNVSSAAFLFDCLTPETIVLIGIAFLDAQAGGWTGETRQCITDVGLEHPEAVYVRMGLEWQDDLAPSHATETLDHNVRIYECMTSAEKQSFTLALWARLDSTVQATGSDIIALLSEAEAACVRQDLSAQQYQAILVSTPLVAITIGSTVSHCIEPETNHWILAHGIEWALGGLSDESLVCIAEFAENHPSYVALLGSGLDNMAAMDPDQFVAITDAGTTQYACMTDEELAKVQEAATAAMSQ